MDRSIHAIGGLLLLTLLMGCGRIKAQAAPTAAPAGTPIVTAAPTEAPAAIPAPTSVPMPADRQAEPEDARIEGYCLSIVDQLPCSADLDGDGAMETVDLVTHVPEDEYPRWALTVTKDGQQKRFETDIPCDMPYDLWMGDLDEDGGYELFFHGDMASDDYLIYGFRWDLSPLLFDPDERAIRWEEPKQSTVFDGYIEGFEDGHIVIDGVVDMLGTHWGVRYYSLGDDGIIGPMSAVWAFDDEVEEDRSLIVTRELTAYKAAVRKDPGEAFTVEPGETLIPLASDGCERMWFKTGKGKSGVLLLTPDEENMWLIDGVPEAEYFETLPYAG